MPLEIKPEPENIPKYILVHHSAADTPTPQFQYINEWHRGRGFAKSKLDFYAGYHRVIEKDGTVVVARGDLERDCDALGHNFDSLSVCLVGDFTKSDPTDEQIAALGPLLAEWVRKYNISPLKIWPHRHFGSTSCYGGRLENSWAAMVYLSYMSSPSLPTLPRWLFGKRPDAK